MAFRFVDRRKYIVHFRLVERSVRSADAAGSAELDCTRVVVAAVQMTSTADVSANLERVAGLCQRAQARGARLVLLPENFALLASDETLKHRYAVRLSERDGSGLILDTLRELAAKLQIHIVLGGFPAASDDPRRVYNACASLDAHGAITAVYRKIHLFDVDFASAATTLRESDTVLAGPAEQRVVAPTPWGGLGLSICYDLRFPELYRGLAQAGARMLAVPAAFTLHTGKDHWHVLLRARAIENQCFVLAAAQQGRHSPTRITYGHSLIVDPWGTVLSDCSDGEGLALAELDFALQDRIRTDLPCLLHRRIGAENS
ncbi:MAG: carbon-nitrogen hydrolase family protein [Myxococcales bacterium]|nr:carbon-nitrogen hydrolase family protein [Myxococcales bacterium]